MATYNDVIEGLKICAKYSGGVDKHLGGAEHDVIFGLPANVKVSQEDIAELEELGWCLSTEYDSWICFV